MEPFMSFDINSTQQVLAVKTPPDAKAVAIQGCATGVENMVSSYRVPNVKN
jgi:hypothetical protein